MIHGAHVVLYSRDAEADRAFLRDVLALPHADAGGGWLIFALPPSEVAVHPAEANGRHEMHFVCEDVEALVADLGGRDVPCTPIEDVGWGRLTRITLPGGGEIGIYQPKHARPRHG